MGRKAKRLSLQPRGAGFALGYNTLQEILFQP
jgi:hypothetical protein